MSANRLNHQDYINKKYGLLTVLEFCFLYNKKQKRKLKYFNCLCECGRKKPVLIYSVLSGNSKSCGCLRKKMMRDKATKHGFALPSKFKKGYRSWYAMKDRCFNPNNHSYKRYGGRGITVCERWLDFNNFIKDMGEKPSTRHSIDRINNNGNYEPSNCRWATCRQQTKNSSSYKHGNAAYKKRKSGYSAWCHIKQRCLNPKSKAYKTHGGRGIELCAEWMLFENFIKDVGKRPSLKHRLKRIDINKNFEPGNCAWK